MLTSRPFGAFADGRAVTLYTIHNSYGESVELLDFGASIHSLLVKDSAGNIEDVVLGVGSAAELGGFTPEGTTIGRCANRIAFGRFELNGKVIQLERNSGEHNLHSASGNYAYRMFRAETDNENNTVSFYLRENGEGGFGCGADVVVRYSFADDHRLEIRYEITPDGDTIINPTNHAFFNLSGVDDIRDHYLRIFAKEYAPKGDIGMPVGEIRDVTGSPLDFTEIRTLRDAIKSDMAGHFVRKPEMYDECFILSKKGFELAAELTSRISGRTMRVYTDMPALILFTPTFRMPGMGKKGKANEGYSSLCLETQFVPNAVNCPEYISPICTKGKVFISRTVYEFTA